MKKKVKLMVALLLCVCLTGAMVVHAESVYRTRDTEEYGLLMTKVDVRSEEDALKGIFSVDWNRDGATLKVKIRVEGEMDDEGERPELYASPYMSDSTGTCTRVEIATYNESVISNAYCVYAFGYVQDGELGENYSLSAWWER